MRKRPGITSLELLLSVAIGGVLALGASTMAFREVDGRATNQESLAVQQAVAALLATFSKDVRAGSGLMVATATECRIRHAAVDGALSFVSYRINNGSLQRGVATTNAQPTTWTNLVDASTLQVAGTFTYFLLGNVSASATTNMRRIEIANFALKVKRTGATVAAPAISAVMRESANVRDLVPSCAVDVVSSSMGGGGCGRSNTPPKTHTHSYNSRGECERDDDDDRDECDADDGGGSSGGSSGNGNSGNGNGNGGNGNGGGSSGSNGGNNPGGATTRVQLCARNASASTIVLNGFGADWGPASASSAIITKVWIGSGSPVWHKNSLGHPTGGVAKTFKRTVSIRSGESIDIQLDFKGGTAIDMKSLALTLFAASDGNRDNPYLITATLP